MTHSWLIWMSRLEVPLILLGETEATYHLLMVHLRVALPPAASLRSLILLKEDMSPSSTEEQTAELVVADADVADAAVVVAVIRKVTVHK